MDSAQPPVIASVVSATARKRGGVTVKLFFIALLVLLLQLPLVLVNQLRQERSGNREAAHARQVATAEARSGSHDEAEPVVTDPPAGPVYNPARAAAEGYRMVERALKHGVLVLTLTFAAFFLFETLAGLRLHAVHYGLVGAALCLFYLALLALGEVLPPGTAYLGAAVASSMLIVGYSASILRSWARAGTIAVLLAAEHSVLYVVLRMEDYALLAGTAALFAALAAVMWFTRKVDWFSEEAGREVAS